MVGAQAFSTALPAQPDTENHQLLNMWKELEQRHAYHTLAEVAPALAEGCFQDHPPRGDPSVRVLHPVMKSISACDLRTPCPLDEL